MPDDLATQYHAMSNDEMLRLGSQYASLTDAVQALVRSEFSRRNLEVPDAPEEASASPLQGVATIRKYRDQAEAILARSVLESAGISCFLRDENTIRMDWLWSNLMGGIRLQVSEADVEAAEAVLSQPIPGHIAVAGEPDYEQPRCPECKSLDITFNTSDMKVAALSFAVVGIPLPGLGKKDFWHLQ